jgi:uncharacterized membrane protein YdjX (TVP38/TMEM64 family)
VRRQVDRAAWRFGLFLAVVALSVAFALLRYRADIPMTPQALGETIRRWDHLGPLLFAAAFVLRPFIFIPSSLLFLAGGLAFGAGWGTLYAAIGATLGSVVGFGVARFLGREFVHARLGANFPGLGRTTWGGGVVLVLYLIPVVPMTAVNYGAGLSRMPLLPFTLAVAGGITPRAFAYTFFGQSLRHVGSAEFILAIATLCALLVIPMCMKRYISRRALRPTQPPNG